MYQPWSELLQEYVNDRGLVDYQGMKRSQQKLDNWLQELSIIELKSLEPKQQKTLWLNLYNALVIRQIIDRHPIKSILPKFLGIPNWWAFWRFFARSVYTVDGKQYSLNQIEHDTIRQQFADPRIHFALVCAAKGCPLLRNEAYQSDRLNTQLEDDAKRFINNPDKIYYESKENILYCSKILKWYKQDFLQQSESLPKYIQTYSITSIPIDKPVEIKYLDYDWHLNQIES